MTNYHYESMFIKMNRDRTEGQRYCDVIIAVDDKRFHTHKCILGTFSEYFDTLFSSKFKDKDDETVKLFGPIGQKITSCTFEMILNYCYSSEIDLNRKNVYDVLDAAEFLQMGRLSSQCYLLLRTTLQPENWLKSFRFGAKYSCDALIRGCVHKFIDIHQQLNINEFTFEDVSALFKFAKSLTWSKIGSKAILEFTLKWIGTVESDEKSAYFDQLVKYIDFRSLSTKYVVENVLTNDIIMNSNTALQQLVGVKMGELQEMEGGILLLGGYKSPHSAQRYLPNSTHKCENIPKPCVGSAVAANDTHVFVAGGEGNECNIQVYDKNDDSWEVFDDTIDTGRSEATATIIGERLYITGGVTPSARLKCTEIFDIGSDGELTRSDDNSMPNLVTGRSHHASVTRDDTIYVLGGWGYFHSCLASCETINISTQERKDIAPLNHGCHSTAAVLFEDSILVIGGWGEDSPLDRVEKYCFTTKQWTERICSLTDDRYCHSALVYNDQIFVIGGHKMKTVEVNDKENEPWVIQDELLSSREGGHAVAW